MRNLVHKILILAYLLSGGITQSSNAQDEAPEAPVTPRSITQAPEQYRLRIQNSELGRIDVSIDNGSHWVLIGRVTKPMTAAGIDPNAHLLSKTVNAPGKTIRIGLGEEKAMTLLPRAATGVKKRLYTSGNIVSNISSKSGLFAAFKPPLASQCYLLRNDSETEFTDAFIPQDDDAFLIKVAGKPEIALKADILNAGKLYFEHALASAKAENRTIISGTLTLKIRTVMDDPDPVKAVFYFIDGETIAVQNAIPFQFQWETEKLDDGEYLVEVRGQNAGGSVVSKSKTLVVVQNHTPTPRST